MMNEKAIKELAAINELTALGAVCEKREDTHGDTRSGWWLDGVFLAPARELKAALEAVRG